MSSSTSDDVIDLSQFFLVLRRRWALLAGGLLIGAIVAGVYTFVIKPEYEAEAAILIPQSAPDVTGGLSYLIPGAGKQSDVSFLGGVLKSRQVSEAVSAATGFKRKKVIDLLRIDELGEARQLVVKFKSEDAAKALTAVQTSIQMLSTLERTVGFSIAGRQAKALESALTLRAKEASRAEQNLLKFQKKAATVANRSDEYTGSSYLFHLQELESERGVVRSDIAARKTVANQVGIVAGRGLPTGLDQEQKWRDELMRAQASLEIARRKYRQTAPEYKEVESRLNATKSVIQAEIAKYVASINQGSNQDIARLQAKLIVLDWQVQKAREFALAAPNEALEFRSLLKNVNATDKIYVAVRQQYEEQRVKAQVDRVQWTVLDPPALLEEPVNKKYALNIGGGALLGIIFGAFLALRGKRN